MKQPAAIHSRLPAEQRRLNLIETAIDLFSRKGFSGTTTKEIAAAAGVTEAIVFRHFATKKDLYTAILERKLKGENVETWMAKAQAFMDQRDDEGLFRFLVSQIIEQCGKESRFERLVLFAALEGQELAVMHAQLATPIARPFIDYIARRQRAGALRKGDPGAILMAIAGLAKFYGAQKYIYRVCESSLSDKAVIDTLMNILMDGLRGKRSKGESK
ncbi:MAG: transcriptional regulator, TetR family [Bryobacterales bacterium]|nr:transcriptional regulator, TetR family [Bryobacterales bacterium]